MPINQSKNSIFETFRGQIPDIFFTNVPLPGFMEKPISQLIFNKKSKVKSNPLKKQAAKSFFYIEGILHNGQKTRYAINSCDIEINNDSWVVGNVEANSYAKANGNLEDSILVIKKIVVLKHSS